MIQISFLMTELLAPPIASLLMESIGPHFAFASAIPVQASAFLLLFLLPRNRATPPTDASLPDTTAGGQETLLSKIRQAVGRLTYYLRYEVSSIFAQRSLLVGLAAMLVAKMGRPILDITLQFMSFKFHWPISKVTMAMFNRLPKMH